MSFDGIVTKSVVEELKEKLIGGRVDKIYQQENDEILIHLHSKGTNYKLILSASSNNPRAYLTNHSKTNPSSPPVFCMLLRKHLIGGIILNVEQFSFDRVIFIDISAIDELGQPTEKRLIVEIMGKHSNIILIDKSSSKIIDSVKRVYEDMSRVRQILPGIIYEYPPVQNKVNPLIGTQETFFNLMESSDKNLPCFKFLYLNYLGLSPLISREICFDAVLDIDRTVGSLYEEDKNALYNSFNKLVMKIKNNEFTPISILSNNGTEIIAFHALELNQFGKENRVYTDSVSKLLDNFYHRKDILDRIGQKSQSIRKSIQVKLDRALNKLGKQKEELLESQDREKYKVYGDLISANLHNIPRGVNNVELDNFYDENMNKLNIPIDIKLSPVANAQKYYKKYSKLKNAHLLLEEQIPETENEIRYLENVLMSIENSTEVQELDEIKEELISEGYIKGSLKKKKKKDELLSKPLHYISQDGFNIYVGKNNKQNDYLTLRLSNRDDIWLHVQKMPGSHVIIEKSGQDIPETTLEEAGILAAYFSKGKNSNHVPVDYTERKNVKKPKNAKAGMVIYENFKTLIINPSKNLVDNIKKVES
ncbi:NFACT family protein [Tissierella pigra]|uniref:Rqc2 homolog RqcH n=1 Tax=Tissierella pigra TaxID=2607614 RepID=A0A6N7XRQ4_9FIRM|nr:NFACT RNA binding domain-containing protein [Tissierella pigra]MBU5426470.1 NFACT family protein [Tissierella pigra]MSU00083.1 fibronectin/fibrinogen-binding protein [Tissierella pigra]